MALEGRIKDFGLADIFQLIHLQKKTGVLTVKNGKQTSTILFEVGMIVGADTNSRRVGDRLGELLVKTKKLTKDQLEETLRLQEQNVQKFGKILEQKGWIKKEELTKILELQIQEMICQLFLLQEGAYSFEQKAVEYNREHINPINTEFILLEGVRRVDEWPMIRKMIPSLELVLESSIQDNNSMRQKTSGEDNFTEVSAKSTVPDHGANLTAEEIQMINLVDGLRDIQAIIEFSQRGEFEACKILAALLRTGMIRVKENREKGATKIKVDFKATSRRFTENVRLTLRWISFATGYVLLMGFIVVSYGYRANLEISLNSIFKAYDALKPVQVRIELERIRTELMLYFLVKHSYPINLDQLVMEKYLSNESIQDAWGHPIQYESLSTGYKLYSSGPDGKGETDDDIF